MKNIVRLLVLAGLTLSAASLSFAGPGLQHWQAIREEAQFQQLKTGDRVALVCEACKTITEQTLASSQQALALYAEGALVHCPVCHAETKVVMRGSPRNPTITREIVYVNDKGEEALFVNKLADAK